MKTILAKGKIHAYEFDDLDEVAQEKALANEAESMLITIDYENQSAGFKKAIHKAESMQTPWFIMSYIFDYAAEEVAANIRLNDDLFDIAGERIPLTHHTHKDVWTLRVGEIVIPVSVY